MHQKLFSEKNIHHNVVNKITYAKRALVKTTSTKMCSLHIAYIEISPVKYLHHSAFNKIKCTGTSLVKYYTAKCS